jgi:hypothetical protein
MPRIVLPVEESLRRIKERSKKSNAASKAKRDAERAAGMPPKKKILTDKQKEDNRIRVKQWREKRKAVKPPRIKMTHEELVLAKRLAARRQYQNRILKQGKIYKPNKIKMEKILKSRPANRISEKVVKPVKDDMQKQPVCLIKADDTGKVKTQLDAKTWVMALPGADIDALRRKYLKV